VQGHLLDEPYGASWVKIYATMGGARAGRLATRRVVNGLADVLATSRASTYGATNRIAAETARSDWNA